MATDVKAVYLNWENPDAMAIRQGSVADFASLSFPNGSMGPKVEAAIDFAQKTGKIAAIGGLPDLTGILRCEAGPRVSTTASLEYY